MNRRKKKPEKTFLITQEIIDESEKIINKLYQNQIQLLKKLRLIQQLNQSTLELSLPENSQLFHEQSVKEFDLFTECLTLFVDCHELYEQSDMITQIIASNMECYTEYLKRLAKTGSLINNLDKNKK